MRGTTSFPTTTLVIKDFEYSTAGILCRKEKKKEKQMLFESTDTEK